MKTCTKCGVKKESSGFFKDKSRKDGLATACRNCRRLYLLQYRKTSTTWHETHRKAVARFKKNNPHKKHILNKIRYYVRIGKIIKPLFCEEKGCKREFIQAHHYLGYEGEHWKDVRWLCIEHHMDAHYRVGSNAIQD